MHFSKQDTHCDFACSRTGITILSTLISSINEGKALSSSGSTRDRYPDRFASVPGFTNGRNPSRLSLFVLPSKPALCLNLLAYSTYMPYSAAGREKKNGNGQPARPSLRHPKAQSFPVSH